MTPDAIRNVLEAAMLAAGRALTLDDFLALFEGSDEAPDRAQLRGALEELGESLEGRAVELVQVASGYRLQVRSEYSPWLGGLFAERPPRYSRALLETLALIAYRQPITRGEIEDVRGVAVSSNIIRTLLEREWVRVLGHREVPGRPALFGTTREFLDHFGLKSLDGLPPLAELQDLDQVEPDLFASAPVPPAPLPGGADGDAGGEPGHEEGDVPPGASSDSAHAMPDAVAVSGNQEEQGDSGEQQDLAEHAGTEASAEGDGGTSHEQAGSGAAGHGHEDALPGLELAGTDTTSDSDAAPEKRDDPQAHQDPQQEQIGTDTVDEDDDRTTLALGGSADAGEDPQADDGRDVER